MLNDHSAIAGAVLALGREVLPEWALVTVLDSGEPVPSSPTVSEALVGENRGCRFCEAGILVPTHVLCRVAQRRNLLAGYDEVWFFAQDPGDVSRPPCRITAAVVCRDETAGPIVLTPTLSTLADWMRHTEAELGFTDGGALVFVARRRDMGREIEALGSQR